MYQVSSKNLNVRAMTFWTPEMYASLERLIQQGKPYKEIADAINELHGTKVTLKSVESQISKKDLARKKQTVWTAAMHETLDQLNQQGKSYPEIADAINKKHGTDVNRDAVSMRLLNKGYRREKHNDWTPAMHAQLWKLKQEGKTHQEIADAINQQHGTDLTHVAVNNRISKKRMGPKKQKGETSSEGGEPKDSDGPQEKISQEYLTQINARGHLTDLEKLRLMQGFLVGNMTGQHAALQGPFGKQYAELYEKTLAYAHAATHSAHAVASLILHEAKPEQLLLDIASGPGTLATAFKQRGQETPHIMHIDQNPFFKGIIRRNHPEHEFIHGDAAKIATLVPKGHYDFATFLFAARHFSEESLAKTAQGANRALRTDGKFILTTPDDTPFDKNFLQGLQKMGFSVDENRPVIADESGKQTKIQLLVLSKKTEAPTRIGRKTASFFRFPSPKESKKENTTAQYPITESQKPPTPAGLAEYFFETEGSDLENRKKKEKSFQGGQKANEPTSVFHPISENQRVRNRAIDEINEQLREEGKSLSLDPFTQGPKQLTYEESQQLIRERMRKISRE